MKDLDFDEIDRAVNSLSMGTPVVDDNNETAMQPIISPPPVAAAPSMPLAGRRSSGQFMDVVHPSSDMRRAPLVMPERTSPQSTAVNNMPITPNPIIQPQPFSNEPATAVNNWPDPIDFTGPKKDEVEEVDKVDWSKSEDADIDRISDDITNELNHKDDEPLDSPFISGTVVDKRPLGAFSTETAPQPTDQIEQNDSIDNTEPIKDAEPTNVDASLPDELQNDLLHIESDDSTTVAETPELVDAAPVASVSAPLESAQPTGPTSIVQQYKEQPSTGEQNTGAIYDTDAYHKPLVQPTKKKSGWLWVLWIFLLIVIGVAAGAAVYKFVLPLL